MSSFRWLEATTIKRERVKEGEMGSVVRSKSTLMEARTGYMVLGFIFLKIASSSGLASKLAPSRLTLFAVFQI